MAVYKIIVGNIGSKKTSILTNSGSRAKMDFSGNATAEKFKYTTKWSSSTKRMLDLVFYKVTPLFFLMPRIRLYKMLFHLIYLKTSVLYKMLVGKYRFQKRRYLSTKWGESTPNKVYILRSENATVQGVNPPLKVEEIWTPILLRLSMGHSGHPIAIGFPAVLAMRMSPTIRILP